MKVRDNRAAALREISELLDKTCARCETRNEMNASLGGNGNYARIDGYCNRECPTGKQLQGLGKQLVRS